jgi:uncharacterized protein
MKTLIQQKLKELEAEKGIEILFACESGSRAWGFESPDSDWDVRFIYKRDVTHYLTLSNPRDVVEVPFDKELGDELDLVGWDIKKTLGLMRGSNPTLLEWLFSPDVYFKDDALLAQLQELAQACWQPRALAHHYVSMGYNNYTRFVETKNNGITVIKTIKAKKLLYVMRSLLNALYIVNFNAIPPVSFETMLSELLPETDNAWLIPVIDGLVAQKKGLTEADSVTIDSKLVVWIETMLDRKLANSIEERPKMEVAEFDRIFQKWVLTHSR